MGQRGAGDLPVHANAGAACRRLPRQPDGAAADPHGRGALSGLHAHVFPRARLRGAKPRIERPRPRPLAPLARPHPSPAWQSRGPIWCGVFALSRGAFALMRCAARCVRGWRGPLLPRAAQARIARAGTDVGAAPRAAVTGERVGTWGARQELGGELADSGLAPGFSFALAPGKWAWQLAYVLQYTIHAHLASSHGVQRRTSDLS